MSDRFLSLPFSILMSIIQVPYEVVQYRMWVQDNFRIHPLALPAPTGTAFSAFDLLRQNACLQYASDPPPFVQQHQQQHQQQADMASTAANSAVVTFHGVGGVNQRVPELTHLSFTDATTSIGASDVSVTPSPGFQNDEGGPFVLFFVADGINSVGDYNSPPGGCRRRRVSVFVCVPTFFHVSRLDNF